MPSSATSINYRTGVFTETARKLSKNNRNMEHLNGHQWKLIIALLFTTNRETTHSVLLVLLALSMQIIIPSTGTTVKTESNSPTPSHKNVTTTPENSVFCIATSSLLLLIDILLLIAGIHPHPGPDTHKEISLIHINVWSLKNKIDIIQPEIANFDIVTLSETWLNNDITNDQIKMQSFQEPIRCDRTTGTGGGVAVYIKNNMPYKERPDLHVNGLEALWLETKIGQDTALVGTFYRPPSARVAYWKLIDQSIKNAMNSPFKVYILGDFNCDVNNNPSQYLLDIIALNNLHQLVDKPTHVTPSSSTCIDLILVSSLDSITQTDVIPPICSDHCAPFVVLKTQEKKSSSFKRKIFDYTKLNHRLLTEKLNCVDWTTITNADTIDNAALLFSKTLTDISSTCMPSKLITVNSRDTPWINENIKSLIKRKNRVHQQAKRHNTQTSWAEFRSIRNRLTNTIRNAKREYMQKLDENISSNNNFGSKQWWKLVGNFLSNKGSNSMNDIPPITVNNKVAYSNKDKATALNNFFASQCTVENDNDDLFVLPESESQIEPLNITVEMTTREIKSLDISKACGPDEVHNKILKLVVDEIATPLTNLFNRSLYEGKFPDTWKTAHVTPIYKKGNPGDPSNYRPISLLSCIGKLLERILQKHMLNYFTTNNIITSCQSGFLPGDSTINQLLTIYTDLCKNLDNSNNSQIVFCDISKAFDKVWHKGLIYKLKCVGVRNHILTWLINYLSNRKQAVVIKGEISSYKPISAGVPQGSVLGPLLFLIYINDIVNHVQSITKLFADDTSLYSMVHDNITRSAVLNADLDRITIWARNWKVAFSHPKTKLMTISRQTDPQVHPLHFGGSPLEECSSHKHLGLHLQTDCKWDSHVQALIRKCRPLVACLRSFKYRLSRKALNTMYKSFILPIIDYADIIWDNCSNHLADEVEALQLDCIRTITGAVRGTSHDKLYRESGYIPLHERRQRHKLIFYHKLVNGIAPDYLLKYLPPLTSSQNPYPTRRPYNRAVPRSKTELYKSSFFPSTTKLWNELPDNIKSNTSLSALKQHLSRNDLIAPNYYTFCVSRIEQIIHCKLRLGISDLNNDLVKRHLSADNICPCGNSPETAYHFLLECQRYNNVRAATLLKLPQRLLNIDTLLKGNLNNSTINENEILFKIVQAYIAKTNRFN